MSQLIEELKADHVTLKQALKQASDVRVPALDRVTMLSEVKMTLLDHLAKENSELYPGLKAASKHDPSLQRTLETFAMDMEGIAKQAMEFFDRYHDPALVAEQMKNNIHYVIRFGGDVERLVILLGLRIGREERILYPEYNRIAPKMWAA